MDRKRHIAIVAGLLALSALVQVLLIRRATVPALDAVGFVKIAQRIDAQGLLPTIRNEREQPLFPAWVWLVREGLARAAGPSRGSWATGVQLAAAIPLVLAVVPVYFVSLRLVGPAPAAAGSLFFCLLPEVSRLGADGLSDGLHLLLFCLAFWAVVVYFSRPGSRRSPRGRASQEGRSPGWLVVAGTLAALAALTRAEALLLPVALAIALSAMQLRARRRRPWSKFATALGGLGLGCGLVFGPYLAAVGATSPRAALARILGRYQPDEPTEPPGAAWVGADAWRLADDEPMSFAPKDTTVSLRRRGYAAATVGLAEESAEAFGYVIGALALFGLWRLRRRLDRPADRFAQVYALLFAAAVFHFAAREGYASARHLLTLVALGVGPAGYGAIALGARIGARRPAGAPGRAPSGRSRGRVLLARTALRALPGSSLRVPRASCPCLGRGTGERPVAPHTRRRSGTVRRALPASGGWAVSPSRMAWATVLAAAAVCFVEGVKPLHASRLGHRMAAEWLGREAAAPGRVVDTRGWTGLYSGRTTCRYGDGPAAFGHPQLAYVVLERRELERASRRSRTIAHLVDVAARPVATFPHPTRDRRGRHSVVVYRWEADRFRRWVAGRSQRRPTGENQHARTRSHVPPERL